MITGSSLIWNSDEEPNKKGKGRSYARCTPNHPVTYCAPDGAKRLGWAGKGQHLEGRASGKRRRKKKGRPHNSWTTCQGKKIKVEQAKNSQHAVKRLDSGSSLPRIFFRERMGGGGMTPRHLLKRRRGGVNAPRTLRKGRDFLQTMKVGNRNFSTMGHKIDDKTERGRS